MLTAHDLPGAAAATARHNRRPMTKPRNDEASETVDAGPFGHWLAQARASLLGDAGADVPCGDCVGCCVSSYPVPIRPQDALAAAEIPVKFLASAPGGRTMMVALPDGTCPMLADRKCSIYGQRPQTCRDYDCRFFAAAGILAGGVGRAVINERVQQWRFTYPNEADRQAHCAVRAAAAFIEANADRFPGFPSAPTGIAVLAIKAYMVFLQDNFQNMNDQEIAHAIVAASRAFDGM